MGVSFFDRVFQALYIGTGFLWTAAWAIFLGLVITSWVQVYVSKQKMARLLGEESVWDLVKATLFGAASSGCSFGAVAIGKGLFKKGAHPTNVLGFMFASTNLIVELGLMIWILMGWQFLMAEILGGLLLIVIMGIFVHFTLPVSLFQRVREDLQSRDSQSGVDEDPSCGMEAGGEYTLEGDGRTLQFCSEGCKETYEEDRSSGGTWWDQLFSWGSWFKLGHRYFMEWDMIYKDVVAGFLISGFVIVFVPQWVWNTLFLQGEGMVASLENAFMGVAVAVISFVGSIGNVPFAVALWSGGVSFAGVIAFVYSDLITIPVLNVYRKYYGWRVTGYIFVVFFVTMALSGFFMEELFTALDIVPRVVEEQSAFHQEYFQLNYTFYLNVLVFGFSGFLYYARHRGLSATGTQRDPICGMRSEKKDLSTTFEGQTYYFCSRGCLRQFENNPRKYLTQIHDKAHDH